MLPDKLVHGLAERGVECSASERHRERELVELVLAVGAPEHAEVGLGRLRLHGGVLDVDVGAAAGSIVSGEPVAMGGGGSGASPPPRPARPSGRAGPFRSRLAMSEGGWPDDRKSTA